MTINYVIIHKGKRHDMTIELIAAAPELLEALEALLPIADGAVDYQEQIDAARAAINKAKGVTQ